MYIYVQVRGNKETREIKTECKRMPFANENAALL